VAIVTVLAVWSGVYAQSQRETWNVPTAPFRIIDNIYYVGTQGLASYLIVTPQGHFLLDGALEESVPQIERNIAALGFKLGDVKYLLNSHAHLDHSGGLARLKKASGAQMIASEGDKSALEGGFYLGWEDKHEYEFYKMAEKRQRQGGGKNPFIDPAEFAAYLAASEADFHARSAKQTAAAKKNP
jgi:metallo-beta-lactamase class B